MYIPTQHTYTFAYSGYNKMHCIQEHSKKLIFLALTCFIPEALLSACKII